MTSPGIQTPAHLELRRFIDHVPALGWSALPDGSLDYVNKRFRDYTGISLGELSGSEWQSAIHQNDIEQLEAWWRDLRAIQSGGTTNAVRLRRFDGEYRWFQITVSPIRDNLGDLVRWCGIGTDINDVKCPNQQLYQQGLDLTITDAIPVGIVVLAPDGTALYMNRLALDHVGLTLDDVKAKGLYETWHPDDRERIQEQRRIGLSKGIPFALEFRVLPTSGEYRWYLAQYNPSIDETGKISRWYTTAIDINDRKLAEEKLRKSEEELRTITESIRQPIVVLDANAKTIYANQVALDWTGLTQEEVIDRGFFPTAFHPDDVERLRIDRQELFSRGAPFDLEIRSRLKSGEYRWYLNQYNPLKDAAGQIIRWYATATDIDDRKKAEERLRNENVRLAQERVYLEDQIRSEMGYEQIIGNSSTLKHVLELVETVAPSDSTVLLLGETGTGKELIARAVHERSRRKAKTFVKLNCAAIPTGLLESELFGHEKGAFTGAIIQKIGRMELADQGTLFLDEVGDIPIDIQPKLLRALQEKEFERLGSTHTRRVNMRLVAATNRNLEKMVAEREFRSDLFYRLNVFPIRIPPLRDRKEDIPLLVAYFVQKFAKQMNKRIDSIPVATMKALTAWEWPGNIRELENFIERAVILSHSNSLAAPLAELHRLIPDEPAQESIPSGEDDITRIVRETIASLKSKPALTERTQKQHDEIIRVLTESKGRVGGADGAAVRMGLSRTTLISRMKKLGINPYDYE